MNKRHSILLCSLLTTFVVCHSGIAWALRVDVVPNTFIDADTDQVNVSCIDDDPAFWAQEIVMMKMSRDHGDTLVILRPSLFSLGSYAAQNMDASGHLDKDSGKSFITIIINRPDVRDSGRYSCSLFYLDDAGQLNEERAFANLTRDDGKETAINKLLSQVSKLERQVTELQHKASDKDEKDILCHAKVADLHEKLSALNRTVEYQGEIIADQQKIIREQNKSMSRIGDQDLQLNAMMRKMKEQDAKALSRIQAIDTIVKNQTHIIEDLVDKDSFVSAFSASYNQKDKISTTVRDTIVYSNTLLNVGNSPYDTVTGVFTAPRHGLYVFTLTVHPGVPQEQVNVDLKVNDVTVATLVSLSAQSTVSPVVYLQTDDKVRPEAWVITSTNVIAQGPYSTFSGYLLKLM